MLSRHDVREILLHPATWVLVISVAAMLLLMLLLPFVATNARPQPTSNTDCRTTYIYMPNPSRTVPITTCSVLKKHLSGNY